MRANLPVASLLLAAVLATSHIAFDPQLSFLRGRTFDLYQVLFPKPDQPSPVVLVTIDEAALAEYGRWPWNRGVVANLVRTIARNRAAVIGLDLLFPEPDPTPNGRRGDNALAAALAESPTVLAASLADTASTSRLSPKVGYPVVGEARAERPGYLGVTASLPEMNEAASGIGIIRSNADPDGVLRQLPLVWLRSNEGDYEVWPAFALELVRVYAGETSPVVRTNLAGFERLRIAGAEIPLQADGSVWLVEKRSSIPRVSALALLDGAAEPRLIDSIAIVGFDAVGLDTFHNTPAHAQRLGTEVHALLAEQLLFGKFLRAPDNAKWIERGWFAGAALVLLVLVALAAQRPALVVPAIVLVVLSPLLAGVLAYAFRNELYESIQPAAALFVVAAFEGVSQFRKSELRRRTLARQFSQFLSPEVVRALAGGDSETALSVDKREITVLMIDLRSFTSMTNALDPGQTVDLVNHFLSLATDEIFSRNGTVDKFIGDAVLAFWNAPLDEPRHTELALEAAEAILSRVGETNAELTARGLPELKAGAALETGVCSVGNFGSSLRIDYTAIGAAVNAAARLQTATKTLGVPLVTGPGFAARTSRELVAIGEIELRGFTGPVKVFTTPACAPGPQAQTAPAS
jgi:adenylate cyclase